VLHNRGIPNIKKYLESTMEDVHPPEAFGQELLSQASRMLVSHVAANDKTLIIVDADCDGFTSSALLINYLYDCFPTFVEEHLEYYLHEGKQHGLSDAMDIIYEGEFKFIIVPDAGSNDFEQHTKLKEAGIDVLILDHHEAEYLNSDYACIINNQLSSYPNKDLSGVGVVWQFCRYLDKISGNNYAENYLDLVALGNMADMMSLKSIETKTLIFEGFKAKNIKNPFIFAIAEKNAFPLSKPDYKPSSYNDLQLTPMGAAFFIAPFVNAIVRSGTFDEKNLIFQSMLKNKAFKMILSNKRGHKLGEQERLVDQAMRTCTNVKNRQTRAEEAGIEHLEGLIEKNHMMEHKVLLFLLEPGEVDRNIAGLVANKFMAKYQRPCCILTKVESMYQGSARGYDASGITNFKDICAAAPGVEYAIGHQGAFGLGLHEDKIEEFLIYTDNALKELSSEPSYFVDYIWDVLDIDGNKILEMADLNDYLGKDIERPLVYIKNIEVNSDTFKVMKSNTLKYICPRADIIQFGASDEEIKQLSTDSCKINAVCKCTKNEWNYQIDPQLILIDYEIVPNKADILTQWGF
jgi:single-stranded-DNA-specific exonuclease